MVGKNDTKESGPIRYKSKTKKKSTTIVSLEKFHPLPSFKPKLFLPKLTLMW